MLAMIKYPLLKGVYSYISIMHQFAILVDYWYVKKSVARMIKCESKNTQIDIKKLCTILREMSEEISKWRLLRFYFYDGAMPNTEMTVEHINICKSNDITLKLWQIRKNPDWSYRQKWVDWLIVTDLLSLSQNRAISDAFIVWGDEDLALWLVYAKNMWVRVHIIGINNLENNIAGRLIEESDIHIHINDDLISSIWKDRTPTKSWTEGWINEAIKAYFDTLSVKEKTTLSISDWQVSWDIDYKLGWIVKEHYWIIEDFKERKKEARDLLIQIAKRPKK